MGAGDLARPHTAAQMQRSAFLGVERSLSGRVWREAVIDEALARRLAHGFELDATVARALAGRVQNEAEAESFLRPTLKASFPDPSSFADMDRAAALLIDAIEQRRRCMVFADYDVDGATSAAQLVRYFRAFGQDLPIYVPDRVREGFGPSAAAFQRMKAEGVELVVTVDCGAAAYDALEEGARLGLDVVVFDHHLMRAETPKASALVNPNRPGCNSGQGHLAAAGVVFVLTAALNREARRRGLLGPGEGPNPLDWLDLAALGAICDVTRLTGFNRAIAAQGLKAMSAWRNPGLKRLAEVAGLSGEADVFHAGFMLGPRINAGGRIGRADLGARLLSTDDPEEALVLAQELDRLNGERRQVEAEVLEAAVRQIEGGALKADDPALIVAGEGWHPGVVGVVASRLRERYRRPTVVIGLDGVAAVGKGSGRSQPGVNLGRAVEAAFDEGLLLAGGGHAMAAGLTIRAERVADFRAFMLERLKDETELALADDALEVEALITPTAADRTLYDRMQALAPFGPGNPEPLVALASVRPLGAQVLKGGHVRADLADERGGRLKAIAWRAGDTALGEALLSSGSLHVVGRLKADDWRGRRGVQLEIEDAADPRRVEIS